MVRAGWRFGALGWGVLVACWTGKDPTPPPSLEAAPRDVTGPYWCAIDDAGYEYARYPCLIKQVRGRLMLAKLGGQQRIRGRITLDADGFEFVGELYCPWGDCTEPMRGRFHAIGRGGFKGTLNGPLDHRAAAGMVVQLIPAPANAFGGSAYGGDGYGDPFGYGGNGYGGDGYGGARRRR
jgi:hypothetical protein